MANLRTAMDAAFWDLHISTPQSLDGISRAVPGEPISLDGTGVSKALRIQQLFLLGNGFPMGIIPSFSPSVNHEELGSFALQSLLGKASFGDSWLGLIGQFRPKKLISSISAEIRGADEWELPFVKNAARHFLDESLYALGLCSQISFAPSSSLLLSIEKHGERKGQRIRAVFHCKLSNQDITLKAAFPELFMDHKGKYWDVPNSVSVDCSSPASESGFRYRCGIHSNCGPPHAVDSSDGKTPLTLMPGMCARLAISYTKNKDLWRQKEKKEDIMIETDQGRLWRPAYDIRLKEPHAAVAGIIGVTYHARCFEVRKHLSGGDLFGSACCTFQRGKFRELFGDLTRIDARLDISSASTLAKKVSNLFRSASNNGAPNLPSSVGLNLIFQQQVAGPIVFRVDSKFSLDSSSGRKGPKLEDLVYSLNYSLQLLRSGKVVAWYSPKRKEGMIELLMFEF